MRKNIFWDLFLYLIVGGIATVVEWVLFYLVNHIFDWHYIVATVFAYIVSTFVNWLAGRIIMFKKSDKGILCELGAIYASSIIGLLFNIAIMWIMVDCIRINPVISKVTATGLVFIWNFLIRKIMIYKE